MKTDGSLDGRYAMELVTPILQTEDDIAKLKAVIKVMEANGTINSSCGVHCHVDVNGADSKDIKKLMKFLCKYESALESLIAPSRRGQSRWCKSIYETETDLVQTFNRLNNKTVRNLINNTQYAKFGRYSKWNFKNFWSQGSFENRCHQATLNADKVEQWVRLNVALIEASFNFRGQVAHANETTKTFGTKKLLDDLRAKKVISLETKKFFMRRYKELNNEVCR
tara:strand:- start:235 stop:906 length:672 start_codon:yes stop_codon:yes gene_type:complete